MDDEKSYCVSEPQKPTPRRKKSRLLALAYDSFWEWQSLTKLGDHLKTEARALKRAPVSVVVGLLGMMTLAVVLFLNLRTKAYQNGVVDQQRTEIQRLEKTRDTLANESNAKIMDLKLDFNETKREKDAQIAKLTSERDAALNRAALFETMPANVASLYSNLCAVYANDPTNRQQIASLLSRAETLTNVAFTIRGMHDGGDTYADPWFGFPDGTNLLSISLHVNGSFPLRTVSAKVLNETKRIECQVAGEKTIPPPSEVVIEKFLGDLDYHWWNGNCNLCSTPLDPNKTNYIRVDITALNGFSWQIYKFYKVTNAWHGGLHYRFRRIQEKVTIDPPEWKDALLVY